MLKKCLVVILTVTLVVGLLTGCQQGEKKTKSSEVTSSSVDNGESKTDNTEKVKISYCSWMTKGEDKVTNDNFVAENPNIEVETISLDGTQYDQLLRTKVLAGDAPDVFIVTEAQMQAFSKDNYLMEITDISAIDNLLADFEGLNETARINGKLYGFPMNPSAQIDQVYYNKNYFKEKGFQEPTSLEEFEQLLADIKADGKEPIVFGGKDAWTSNAYAKSYTKALNLPKYNGIEFDEKLLSGEAKMSDYYREAFDTWESYIKNGYVSPASVSLTYDQSVQYFADGKAELLAQGPWIASMDNVKNAEGMDLGAFLMPVPKTDGKRYITGSATLYLAISSKTKHPEEAKKLLEYWTTPEVLKEYGDRTGNPTLYPVGYSINPILQGVEESKAAADVILDFSGQLSKVPQGVYDETQICMVNIAAGSSAQAELDRLDSVFEKAKSTMTIK